MAVIYGLYSTRDNTIRYVGQTHRITARIAQHLIEARSKDTPKCSWIASEQAEGFDIKYVILMENCNGEVNERRIIDAYTLSGHELVNSMHFPSHKDRQREGMARAKERGVRFGRKPTTPEQVAQIKEMHKAGSSIRQICRTVRVSPNTVMKTIKEI